MMMQRSEVTSPMLTNHVDLGPVRLLAPDRPPRYTRGTLGEMWQWIGDGENLISLILAARSDSAESAVGVRHRLLAEVQRIGGSLTRSPDAGLASTERAYIPGSSASFIAHVDGVREGILLHNAVVMAAARETSYLLHLAATATPAGRELASRMSLSLRLAE